jgi:hypothetical protein
MGNRLSITSCRLGWAGRFIVWLDFCVLLRVSALHSIYAALSHCILLFGRFLLLQPTPGSLPVFLIFIGKLVWHNLVVSNSSVSHVARTQAFPTMASRASPVVTAIAMVEANLLLCISLTLLLAFVAGRVWSWYRLRHIPGPLSASLWKGWMLRHNMSGRMNLALKDVCDQYGEFDIYDLSSSSVMTNLLCLPF